MKKKKKVDIQQVGKELQKEECEKCIFKYLRGKKESEN